MKYGRLPELERKLKQLNEAAESKAPSDNRMLREEVGPEEIAEVVAKWTGIPVSRMLLAEQERLLKMEESLREVNLDCDENARLRLFAYTGRNL